MKKYPDVLAEMVKTFSYQFAIGDNPLARSQMIRRSARVTIIKEQVILGDCPNPATVEDVAACEERIDLRKPNGEKYKMKAKRMLDNHTILGTEGVSKNRNRRFLLRERNADNVWVYWFPER